MFAPLGSAFARETSDDGKIPGQYIVVFKDLAVSEAQEDAVILELVDRHHLRHDATFTKVFRGMVVHASDLDLAQLKKDPRVDFISQDRTVSIDAARVTTEAVQTLPTGVNRVNAEGRTNSGAGVNVAVIDTGIDTSHPDLKANIAGGKNCSSGSSYVDGNGHGTHVAGTIAAVNNSFGVVGVAPSVKLWSVRVLNNQGSGTWSSVICGIDFVTSKAPKNGGPITVANMSLGGAGTSDNNCGNTNNDALHKAICRSRDAGVTYVVAAGNSAADTVGQVPAAYNDAVITVSALADSDGTPGGVGAGTSYGADDTFATFSNYGSAVDIAAPGVNIYSTWKGGGYVRISGTSMASPHVVGAAALYIATHPGAVWTVVRDALVALGEPLGSGHADPSGKHFEPVLRVDTL
jgi:subtilisin family serine protease